jgi:hypothetical protein
VLEHTWGHAMPGHEAVDVNELLRALQRLIKELDRASGRCPSLWLCFTHDQPSNGL